MPSFEVVGMCLQYRYLQMGISFKKSRQNTVQHSKRDIFISAAIVWQKFFWDAITAISDWLGSCRRHNRAPFIHFFSPCKQGWSLTILLVSLLTWNCKLLGKIPFLNIPYHPIKLMEGESFLRIKTSQLTLSRYLNYENEERSLLCFVMK